MTRQELLKIAKPIIFSTEMVRAILDDRKTMTRRVIKPQPDTEHSFFIGRVLDSTDSKNIGLYGWGTNECGGNIQYIKARYEIGDILWVRETFCPIKIKKPTGAIPEDFKEIKYIYKADDNHIKLDNLLGGKSFFKWKPSIFMPKSAARIFLKVTNVRVERLQDITIREIKEEGYPYEVNFFKMPIATQGIMFGWWINSWNFTVKKQDLDKYGWEANPWVWVIEFEKIKMKGGESIEHNQSC